MSAKAFFKIQSCQKVEEFRVPIFNEIILCFLYNTILYTLDLKSLAAMTKMQKIKRNLNDVFIFYIFIFHPSKNVVMLYHKERIKGTIYSNL